MLTEFLKLDIAFINFGKIRIITPSHPLISQLDINEFRELKLKKANSEDALPYHIQVMT